MDEIFDTFAGLPLHVLLVHGLVVGIPVMALATVAVAAREPWRDKLSWLVVAANAGLLALAWVTTQSGQELRDRRESLTGTEIESIARHEDRGDLIPFFVLGLLVVSVLGAVTRRRPALRVPLIVLAVVVGAAAIWWTVLTGHSGSASVWGDLVEGTNP